MATQLRPYTADDLFGMPRDGTRRHIINGVLHESPPRQWRQAVIVSNVLYSMDAHVRQHQLGEVLPGLGCQLSSAPDTVCGPDVSFVASDRLAGAASQTGFFIGAPDLAVEVMPPDDVCGEVAAKVDEYLAAGTRMVLVVDPPRRTVAVHRSRTEVNVLTEADVLDGADVVPGWSVPVREVFA